MKIIRIFLLRVFLGWWFIPCVWILAFPIAILLTGLKTAISDMKALSKAFWNGV